MSIKEEYLRPAALYTFRSAVVGHLALNNMLALANAERYNPRYGTGLIPESASAAEEIVVFWARHHFGRAAKKVLALANNAQPGNGCG